MSCEAMKGHTLNPQSLSLSTLVVLSGCSTLVVLVELPQGLAYGSGTVSYLAPRRTID